MKFTVLGSQGFIGRRMVQHLRDQGAEVATPIRDTPHLRGESLGHVIYCIGLTGNFRQRPEATMDAHLHTLERLMDGAAFDSWLYLSSTRLYAALAPGITADEDAALTIVPSADTLYDLSKLQGEQFCLDHPNERVRVARLSNVYGPGQSTNTFLGAVLQEAAASGRVTLRESPASGKDYIALDDVVESLHRIALQGRQRRYNVATGETVTHAALAARLRALGCGVDFAADAPTRLFPAIAIDRLRHEFAGPARRLTQDIAELFDYTKRHSSL